MFLITMINSQGKAVGKLLSPHSQAESEFALTINGWTAQDGDPTGEIWVKDSYDGLVKLQRVRPMPSDEIARKIAELEKR